MKRAAYLVVGVNLLLGLAACGQTVPQLFKAKDHTIKAEPVKPAVAKIEDDIAAVQKWWNELHGDAAGKPRIVEMKPRMLPKDFEVKYDSGHPAGPYWLNCAEFLEKSRDPDADRGSVLYPLRNGASGAHAFTARIGSTTHAAKSGQWMFVIANGEVIYSTDSFRSVR